MKYKDKSKYLSKKKQKNLPTNSPKTKSETKSTITKNIIKPDLSLFTSLHGPILHKTNKDKLNKPDKITRIDEVFEYLDKDKSGDIDFEELQKGLNSAGINLPDQLTKKIFNLYDTNIKDNKLDKKEFKLFLEEAHLITRLHKPEKINKKGGTKKNLLTNSKNKSCKSQKFTACCPHMIPDNKGRYAATGTKHILKYKGKNYKLMTCCQMCGDIMNKISKENPKKFEKLYIKYIDKKGNIHAKNRHTNEVVQILKKI